VQTVEQLQLKVRDLEAEVTHQEQIIKDLAAEGRRQAAIIEEVHSLSAGTSNAPLLSQHLQRIAEITWPKE
jgi:uncharacterized coiled-coil protein SlyX